MAITSKAKLIVFLLDKIVDKHPELRVCQIIGNCFDGGDLYYKEDEELLKNLKLEYLGETNGKTIR